MSTSTAPDPLGLVSRAEGAIIGTVVSAAVIAYSAVKADSAAHLSLAILGTVAVYWLAHLHAVTLARSLIHRHRPVEAVRVALSETWPVAGAGVIPVGVLAAATLVGADLRTASWTALIVTIALLSTYSYLAGARSGLTRWGRFASAGVGAGIGLLVALLKVALH
jgi:hypothetical protein